MAVTEVDTLVDRFIGFLARPDEGIEILAPDVFADVNVPHWRYQLQGAEALAGQLKADSPFGAEVTKGRCVPTSSGFVVEAQYVQKDHHGEEMYYRTLWLVEVAGGRIAEVVLYCSGEWDAATRARQAAEAPMIRP